jgi:uncharacterized protein (TIGR03435 family)
LQIGQRVSFVRCAPVFILCITPPIAWTQAFVKVDIKPSASTNPGPSRLQILPSGELIGRAVPIVELINLAYDVPDNPTPRLSSLPDWADHERFDIEAKTSASLNLGGEEIPAQKRTIQKLIQSLLADRFDLALSVRTERIPVYMLSVAARGPKLERAAITPRECILDTGPDGCHSFSPGFGHPLNGRAVDMSDLAHYLENWTDLPAVNRTGLRGLFNMHSQGWRPMKLPPPPPGSSGTGEEFRSLPKLSTVLAELGLQLLRGQESQPVYTVERIHQPNAN